MIIDKILELLGEQGGHVSLDKAGRPRYIAVSHPDVADTVDVTSIDSPCPEYLTPAPLAEYIKLHNTFRLACEIALAHVDGNTRRTEFWSRQIKELDALAEIHNIPADTPLHVEVAVPPAQTEAHVAFILKVSCVGFAQRPVDRRQVTLKFETEVHADAFVQAVGSTILLKSPG